MTVYIHVRNWTWLACYVPDYPSRWRIGIAVQRRVLWLENYGQQASDTCSHGVTNQHKVIALGFA